MFRNATLIISDIEVSKYSYVHEEVRTEIIHLNYLTNYVYVKCMCLTKYTSVHCVNQVTSCSSLQ